MRRANGLSLFSGDNVANGVPVLIKFLTDIIELICKGHLHRIEGILRIFDQFSLRWRDVKQLFGSKNTRFSMLLEDKLGNVFVMGPHDEDVLIRKIFQSPSLDEKFR